MIHLKCTEAYSRFCTLPLEGKLISRLKPSGATKVRSYRYSFLNKPGVVDATLELHSDNDESACALGSELLSRSKCIFVEVRRGSELIFQIRRDGSQVNRRDAPFGDAAVPH